ncbi:MAG TPA: c-type cytochrome [Nitrospinota bacterium]|nr:c-type cytochrome [Nitrospinota bacterium]|tara:strand:- start:41516 stop:43324 length:1809 start_codon:yes stop_codon:yes gene_type:complete
MTVRIAFLILGWITLIGTSQINAAIEPKEPKPVKTKELLDKGRITYFERCSFCHGVDGGGDGPVAEFLNPRPRNFKTNVFKFRSTASGALPLDEDLFETISKGIQGTAMQSFDDELTKTGLTEEERWGVIYFIQTFSDTPDFSLWMLDEEYKNADDADDKAEYRYNKLVKIGDGPTASDELINNGEEIYKKAKCAQCHGENGRGNGVSANGMKDDWGFSIAPRDLTKEWKYKGGASVKEIFSRFTTGLNGTPMPSFANSIKEEERWALAHFVQSLQYKPNEEQNLQVPKVEGELPVNPEDEMWKRSGKIDVLLTGNVLIKPRWQNITVDLVEVQALYNDKEIAFRLSWHDRFANVIHEGNEQLHQTAKKKPEDRGGLQTYVPIYSSDYKPGRYRDSVMLQFPVKLQGGSEKPHFLNGDPRHEVNMWWWRSDYDLVSKSLVETQRKQMADLKAAIAAGGEKLAVKFTVADIKPDDTIGKKGPAVIEVNAKGFKKSFKIQADTSQAVTSSASFNDGVWTVVMKRPLVTENKKDIQFEPGKFIPIAVNAWDGWNKDIGMRKSVSSWYYLYLEKPMPVQVYGYTALSFLAICGLQVFLSRKWRKEK